jgi:cytochrome c oxidase cbb3-type subunit III
MNLESRKPEKERSGRSSLLFSLSHSILLLCCLSWLGACKREERGFRVQPPAADKLSTLTMSDLHPGSGPTPPSTSKNSYEESAYAISEGQKLYLSMNCVGCHFHGGGGIGPALMDNEWVYGSDPQQIFATIVEGRPNGMPSFRGKIPDYQVWQIAAYVRSLGGLAPSSTAPGRGDEMEAGHPPNSNPAQTPQNSSLPKSAEHP